MFRLIGKLTPLTSNMWANHIIIQWDQYLDLQEDMPEMLRKNLGYIKFRAQDKEVTKTIFRAI